MIDSVVLTLVQGPTAIHQLPPSYSTMFINTVNGSVGAVESDTDPGDASAGTEGRGVANCPYFQLYGPPPSYDSVIQLTSDGVRTVVVPTAATTTNTATEDDDDEVDEENKTATGTGGGNILVNKGVDEEEHEPQGVMREIVISEPLRASAAADHLGPRCLSDVNGGAPGDEVLKGEMPFISAKCNATEPEDYNNPPGTAAVNFEDIPSTSSASPSSAASP